MKKILLILMGFSIQVFCQAQINSNEANYYTIKAINTSFYLGMQNGINHTVNSLTTMSSRAARADQVWKIERQADLTYIITNAVSGLSLDGSCASVATGCNLITKNVNNKDAQKWNITQISRSYDNRYRIVLANTERLLTSKYNEPLTLDEVFKDNQVFEIAPSKMVVRTEKFTDLRVDQTPYKNQTAPTGERGGCTYFGSIAALEAAYKKRGYGNLDLSEEFMAITSKMFYLHPIWRDITNVRKRENQYAGSQGGGSIAFLASGNKVPLERVVPYGQYTLSPYWANPDIKICNNFNFTTLKRFSGIRAATYYGVNKFKEIKKITAENLEQVLKSGREIKINIDGGSHCILLVGFDKTNPANKQFIIKNSYNTPGLECYKKLEYYPYANLNKLTGAEYIISVTKPAKWNEMSFIGSWDLNFAGWTGTLDIYHLPGSAKYLLSLPEYIRANGAELKDTRIGMFYDHTGTPYRVNGYFVKINNELYLNFYFDGNKPNLRWDERPRQRVFTYKVSADGNNLTGRHYDLDGKVYNGSATRKL